MADPTSLTPRASLYCTGTAAASLESMDDFKIAFSEKSADMNPLQLKEVVTLKEISTLSTELQTSVSAVISCLTRARTLDLSFVRPSFLKPPIPITGNDLSIKKTLPSVKVIKFDGQEIETDDLHALEAFPNLTELSLANCRQITDKSLHALLTPYLSFGIQEFPKINVICLSFCKKITEAGLTILRKSPDLWEVEGKPGEVLILRRKD